MFYAMCGTSGSNLHSVSPPSPKRLCNSHCHLKLSLNELAITQHGPATHPPTSKGALPLCSFQTLNLQMSDFLSCNPHPLANSMCIVPESPVVHLQATCTHMSPTLCLPHLWSHAHAACMHPAHRPQSTCHHKCLRFSNMLEKPPAFALAFSQTTD